MSEREMAIDDAELDGRLTYPEAQRERERLAQETMRDNGEYVAPQFSGSADDDE